MAELRTSSLVRRNQKGQSVVEYIMLLAVISAISYSFYNNPRFKEFIGGNSGLFAELRKGMEYSYRYGRAYKKSTVDIDQAVNFDYQTNGHDTYFNKEEGQSRFFGGTDPYGTQ